MVRLKRLVSAADRALAARQEAQPPFCGRHTREPDAVGNA